MAIQKFSLSDHMLSHPENVANVSGARIVHYDQILDEYFAPIRGGSRQLFSFCPFCGQKFPYSQRERWFDEIEKLGFSPFDPHLKKKLPKAYKSAAWRLTER